MSNTEILLNAEQNTHDQSDPQELTKNSESVSEKNKKKTWFFTIKERVLINLNLIDVSRQFDEAAKFSEILDYEIKFNNQSFKPYINNQEWMFFDKYENFYSKFCDVKIKAIMCNKQFSLENYLIRNLNLENLFASLLFQMFPIYKCLKLNRTFDKKLYFKNEVVETNIVIDNKKQTMNVQFPLANFYLEEIFMVNTLQKLYNLDSLPGAIDPLIFWTLFIYSVHFRQQNNYVYKTFILNWHESKGIPMLNLFVYQTIADHSQIIFYYLYLFLKYFYNNNYLKTNPIVNINACWQKMLLYEKDSNIKIINDTVFVNNAPQEPTLKLFPCVLTFANSENCTFCFYYKTNVDDLEMEFTFDNSSETWEMKKEKFHLFVNVKRNENFDSLLENIVIKLKSKNNFVLYFGNKIASGKQYGVEKSSFDYIKNNYQTIIDNVENNFLLYFLDSDYNKVYFDKLKCYKPFPLEYSKVKKTSNFIGLSHYSLETELNWKYNNKNVRIDDIMRILFGLKSKNERGSNEEDFFKLIAKDYKRLVTYEPLLKLDEYEKKSNQMNIDIKIYEYIGHEDKNKQIENEIFFKTLQLTGVCIHDFIPSFEYKKISQQFELPNLDEQNYSESLNKFSKDVMIKLQPSFIIAQTAHNKKLDAFFIASKLPSFILLYNFFLHSSDTQELRLVFKAEDPHKLVKSLRKNYKLQLKLFFNYTEKTTNRSTNKLLKELDSNDNNIIDSLTQYIKYAHDGKFFIKHRLTLDDVKKVHFGNIKTPFKISLWALLYVFVENQIQSLIFFRIEENTFENDESLPIEKDFIYE